MWYIYRILQWINVLYNEIIIWWMRFPIENVNCIDWKSLRSFIVIDDRRYLIFIHLNQIWFPNHFNSISNSDERCQEFEPITIRLFYVPFFPICTYHISFLLFAKARRTQEFTSPHNSSTSIEFIHQLTDV